MQVVEHRPGPEEWTELRAGIPRNDEFLAAGWVEAWWDAAQYGRFESPVARCLSLVEGGLVRAALPYVRLGPPAVGLRTEHARVPLMLVGEWFVHALPGFAAQLVQFPSEALAHYNHVRPHSRLKDLTPIEFKSRYDSTNPGAILK